MSDAKVKDPTMSLLSRAHYRAHAARRAAVRAEQNRRAVEHTLELLWDMASGSPVEGPYKGSLSWCRAYVADQRRLGGLVAFRITNPAGGVVDAEGTW